MGEHCLHLDQVQEVRASSDGCDECRKGGDQWVHLRICLSCGNVGCCNSSKNQHATRHFQTTGHPLMASIEASEFWGWCFVDGLMFETEQE